MNKITIYPSIISVFIAGLALFLFQNCAHAQKETIALAPVKIVELMGDQPLTRAGRPFVVLASINNPAATPVQVTVLLKLPDGISCEDHAEQQLKLSPNESIVLRWTIFAEKAIYEELVLEIKNKDEILAAGRLPVRFLPAMDQINVSYIPKPTPVKKEKALLIGAHHCPLWESDSYELWSQLKKHPERTPVLGFYAQENPEIADWETKWAVEQVLIFLFTAGTGPARVVLWNKSLAAICTKLFLTPGFRI